jgi:hypothetical protein
MAAELASAVGTKGAPAVYIRHLGLFPSNDRRPNAGVCVGVLSGMRVPTSAIPWG